MKSLVLRTKYGEAARMIQFKEKSKNNSNFSVGLLTYPILMAVDILFCEADFVPVGIDQKQHVELTRNIAERFNKKYGKTFVLPEPLINEVGTKIRDLKNPLKKMSKSDENPEGVISLFDDVNEIRKKIMKATTDSENIVKFDMENKPGISNLLNIASSLTKRTIADLENEFANSGYGVFKSYVADITINFISEIQKKYNEILNGEELNIILDEGRDKTRELAKEKFELMKKRMGVGR